MAVAGASSVVVVGAGVFGLATALALAEAGRRVTVLTDAAPLQTASGVAAGMLAPAFETLLDPPATEALDLMIAARDLWPDLAARLGVELDRRGAAAVDAADWVEDLEARFAARGLAASPAERSELETWAPGLNPRFRRGLVTPEDWRISPEAALPALIERLQGLGGTLERRRATRAELDAECGPIVLATGADPGLAALAPELARLSPVKGQILRRTDLSAPRRVLRTRGAYVLGSEGAFLAGATMEPGRSDTAPDLTAQAGLRRGLENLFPALPPSGWETRAGVRAASPDGLPLAGRSTRKGVFLAVGARRNGWLLAPMVARIVGAAINGDHAAPGSERLDPGRFGPAGKGDGG